MKNYEKYAEKIREYKGNSFCSDFIKPYILKLDSCGGVACEKCHMLQTMWLLEEYEDPEVDWSKVEVDTPILVRHSKNDEWARRHFAKYENGTVYAWQAGCTSWTVPHDKYVADWKDAKLAESEEE